VDIIITEKIRKVRYGGKLKNKRGLLVTFIPSGSWGSIGCLKAPPL
jgi:hypothetical protein